MKLTKVVSGGQTGVDRAALDAAEECGIERGGFCPKGRLAEDGRIPDHYPLIEMPTTEYPPRTRANVEAADATLLLVWGAVGRNSPGSKLAIRLCLQVGKPLVLIDLERATPRDAVGLMPPGVAVLNVAGNRESSHPGIGDLAMIFLVEFFRRLEAEQ